MSESFDDAIAFAQAIMSDCDTPILDRLKRAHDHEIVEALCDACDQCDRMDKKAHDHEIEQMRKAEFARGYDDGRRSKDADHAAVALRLSRLTFDGGSHENLSKIAYTIYPCATGWTCESAKGLRDRLIDLLGGVHEHHCDSGRGCACGNRDSGDSGEHAEAMTCDVLGNERHKAVCELRKIPDTYDMQLGCSVTDQWYHDLCKAICIGYRTSFAEARDRLIHLLGGDECNFSTTECDMDAKDAERNPAEMSGNDNDHVSFGTHSVTTASITDELREWMDNGAHYNEIGYEVVKKVYIPWFGRKSEIEPMLDRIDEQFGRCCELWERAATDTAQSVHDDMEAECNKLHAECDRLTAALDELHADPANDVICRLERERGEAHAKVLRLEFENAEWRRGAERDADKLESLTGAYNDAVAERDELQKRLDEMREQREHWASEATKMYRLFFSHDEYCVPNSPSEMVSVAVRTLQEKCSDAESECRELRTKMDVIQEVLDDNH